MKKRFAHSLCIPLVYNPWHPRHKHMALLSDVASWTKPALKSAIAAIDDAWTMKQVRLLRSWAMTHGDVSHRESAVAALDEHLADVHKLETNDFLRIAYLLNGGLLLDETIVPEGASSAVDSDDLHSLNDDFETLLRENEKISAATHE